jgi:hypothetical protein
LLAPRTLLRQPQSFEILPRVLAEPSPYVPSADFVRHQHMSTWFRPCSPANKLKRCDIRTTMMDRNVILSFSFDRERLAEREIALRHCGCEVSASTASHARFEIEMGRCGVLLICQRSSALTASSCQAYC